MDFRCDREVGAKAEQVIPRLETIGFGSLDEGENGTAGIGSRRTA